MAGRNCEETPWPGTGRWKPVQQLSAEVEEGYALFREGRGTVPAQLVTRPCRGSGSRLCLWSDRKRAERECDSDERVVHVRLHMEIL